MVNLKVGNQMTRKNIVVSANTTIEAALEQAGIEPNGLVTLQGTIIGKTELGRTLAEYGVGETAILNVNAKTDNAAQIVLAGEVGVIKSAWSYDNIATIEKYKPEALEIREGEDVVFKVGTTEGHGTASKYGLEFAKTESDSASVAVELPAEGAEAYVMDTLGPVCVKLAKLEEGFEAALAEIEAQKTLIASMITTI